MFKFLGKLLSSHSEYSSMRAMALICVLAAVAVGIYGIHENRDLIGVSALVTAFLGPALGAKVGQKYFERKELQAPPESN